MRNCSAHARAGISRWWRKCTKWTPRARAKALRAEAAEARVAWFRETLEEFRTQDPAFERLLNPAQAQGRRHPVRPREARWFRF